MYGGEEATEHEMASRYTTKELVQNNALGWQLTAERFNKPSPYKHSAVLICDTFASLVFTYNYWPNQFPYCPLESHDPQTLVQLRVYTIKFTQHDYIPF
jgi:hypothetical protein